MKELTDGIQDTLDYIFAGVLVGGIDPHDKELKEKKRDAFRQNLPRFLSRFQYNVFEQEYSVFWELLTRIKGGLFTSTQIETILENNTDIILQSKYIDLQGFASVNDRMLTQEEKFLAFKEMVLRKFQRLSNEYVDETQFKSAVDIYINWYVDELALATAQNMTLIMSDEGLTVKETNGRKRTYKGIEDYMLYFNKQQAIWQVLRSGKSKRDVLIDSEWLNLELENINKENKDGILTTGLEVIDNTMTAIRRTHMVNIVGQTKGGKTRFVNYLCARALKQGLNVAVWALEGSRDEWLACQTSNIVFDEYAASEFKNGKYTTTNDSGVIVIPTDRMLNNQFKNQVEREAAIAAKTKLATDYTRGKLSFIETTCYVEDFLDTLDSHYENCNQFDVIIMDSPLLVQSKTGMPMSDRIANCFIKLKSYIEGHVRGPIAITTAQLKQTVIDDLRRDSTKEMDVTAAGGSAEAIRTPDEVIGIFSSKESRDNNQVTLESIASRHHENFEKFICSTNLGSCYFTYRPELQQIH